ncbi:DUF3425 domain-containing protein [Aspergillus tubingensis]|uniref:BZIP domain-containing protein n=1 Tax=Aspergillus niger TaxID=5061 RepID=A0A100IJA3_ASPNG|nr:uncharacterized protein AtWU_06709 [Aspergillus tubingensis]GAQ42268.1 hypothetical protein EURHEDRAFT_416483 [Aspergillus niger]GFN16907.1 hypothetical protein AtWU_06709 [Aspergillus tubingensis]GLA92306.1 hypothetical protein AtubIFM57143_007824 [Aspergillus tubingensis]
MSNVTVKSPEGRIESIGDNGSIQYEEKDRKERRRRQNRLNQQTWRERQRIKKEAALLAEKRALQEHEDQVVAGLTLAPINPMQTQQPLPPADLTRLISMLSTEEALRLRGLIESNRSCCVLPHPHIYRLLAVFEAAAYQSYAGNPQADHLLTLGKLNVFRAFVRNIAVLVYSREWMTDDAISRFSISGPSPSQVLPEQNLPFSLRPTQLQHSQPHHPWLDFFPFARLRDNLIQNENDMDDSQFCRDLMGFWTMPQEDTCVFVWGDPWNPMNWEITEAFLRKWGWLLEGCPEIFWSTNYWRQLRGEKRLNRRATLDVPTIGVV